LGWLGLVSFRCIEETTTTTIMADYNNNNYADDDGGDYEEEPGMFDGQGGGGGYDDDPQGGGLYDDQQGGPYYDDQDQGEPYDDDDQGDDTYQDAYNDHDDDQGAPLGQHDQYGQQQQYHDNPGGQQQYHDDDGGDDYEDDGDGYDDRRHGSRRNMGMPRDYYADEYGDADDYDDYDEHNGEHYVYEDEEERLNQARRRRAWCCCLLLMCCLLILIILLIIFLLYSQSEDKEVFTDAPTFAPFVDDTDDDYYYDDDIIIAPGVVTSTMAKYDFDCDYDNQVGWPNVWDQCDCDGEISIVPQDVIQMRELLVERLLPKIYNANSTNYVNGTNTYPLNSCDPINMALLWLASGDMRDAGEIRQRFVLGVSFFGLNGTIWDYTDAWLSDLNECLWMGVQCNNRDTVNSMALDTNNIFGLVSDVLYIKQTWSERGSVVRCYSHIRNMNMRVCSHYPNPCSCIFPFD
jgi:hypothetical protein